MPTPCVIGFTTSISRKLAGGAYASSSVCRFATSRCVAVAEPPLILRVARRKSNHGRPRNLQKSFVTFKIKPKQKEKSLNSHKQENQATINHKRGFLIIEKMIRAFWDNQFQLQTTVSPFLTKELSSSQCKTQNNVQKHTRKPPTAAITLRETKKCENPTHVSLRYGIRVIRIYLII